MLENASSMITLTRAQVPEYLHDSDFFQALSEDDTEEISIPTQNFKETADIANIEDLRRLLSTARFWGLHRTLKELVEYAFTTKTSHYAKVFAEFENELHNLQLIKDLQSVKHSNDKMLAMAAKGGDVVVFRHVFERSGKKWSSGHKQQENLVCAVTAEAGFLECLQFAHENGCAWDENTCILAAGKGRLECLKYAHENKCPWGELTVLAAAKEGHLNCLRYAHEQGCPWNALVTAQAAESGHKDCLAYAMSNGCPVHAAVCAKAASGGHLQCLQYAHQHGARWNEGTCVIAAKHGHLDCLEYAHENGCRWTSDVTTNAAQHGQLECFRYACANGCPLQTNIDIGLTFMKDVEYVRCLLDTGFVWTSDALGAAILQDHVDLLRFLHERGVTMEENLDIFAAGHGKLSCLQYIHEHIKPMQRNITSIAAQNGMLDCLKYAHENGDCDWDNSVFLGAACGGHLECFRYAFEHDCPVALKTSVCTYAALFGKLDVLKFAVEVGGFCFNKQTCASAAQGGHLECLSFLHEHGCPWDESICQVAAWCGHLPCLEYAHENGCPWDESCCEVPHLGTVPPTNSTSATTNVFANIMAAIVADDQVKSMKCLAYALRNGCPWHDHSRKAWRELTQARGLPGVDTHFANAASHHGYAKIASYLSLAAFVVVNFMSV